MWVKRIFYIVLACVLIVRPLAVPSNASESNTLTFEYQTSEYITSVEHYTNGAIAPYATKSFSMSIPAKSQVLANSSFSLAAWETVTIKASYSPFSASVDYGIVAPDGIFYCYNSTNGSMDNSIQVSESGEYTLQIRNNSNVAIDVSGFVNY